MNFLDFLTFEAKVIVLSVSLIVTVVFWFAYRRIPKSVNPNRFANRWQELQSYCRDKTTWPQAILTADKLLDEVLKRRKFKGSSMGERMVSAQRYFTNNDDLWFAHNLCKKLKADAQMKLKEDDVKEALVGFRQGLRDLGALEK